MAKTVDDAAATMIENLKEKTGKTLEQWITIAAKLGLPKHSEIVKALKTDHGLTHGYANLIALKALKSDAGSANSAQGLIDAQYAGDKAGLRPVYEALLKIVTGLGKDVVLAPKKAYVSVRRSKQFAIIQPSTKTRVDIGINLKGVKPEGRLEKSGSFNAMVSHRVRLESKSDIDAQLKGWLKAAYDAA
jgi:predicted transport protein